MRVITVRLVKLRKFANIRVDQISTLGMVARIYFKRLKGNRRKLFRLRVDRLTANNNDLGVTRDLTGRANNMFELNTIYR